MRSLDLSDPREHRVSQRLPSADSRLVLYGIAADGVQIPLPHDRLQAFGVCELAEALEGGQLKMRIDDENCQMMQRDRTNREKRPGFSVLLVDVGFPTTGVWV